MCRSDGLESDGHVVELDDVVEIPTMTILATLGSVVGVLTLGLSFSFRADLSRASEDFHHLFELCQDICHARHGSISLRTDLVDFVNGSFGCVLMILE